MVDFNNETQNEIPFNVDEVPAPVTPQETEQPATPAEETPTPTERVTL